MSIYVCKSVGLSTEATQGLRISLKLELPGVVGMRNLDPLQKQYVLLTT